MATASSGSWFKPQNLGAVLLVGGGCSRTLQVPSPQTGPQTGLGSSSLPVTPEGTKKKKEKERREESKSTLNKQTTEVSRLFGL